MNRILDILKWLTPLIVLLATACGHEELLPLEEFQEGEAPYVEVRIAVPLANPTATRANPMGGEEGNGRERGILNEDKIHDINVFFYIEEAGKGMDSSDDTEIIKHIYYNLDDPNDTYNTPLVVVNENSDQSAASYLEYGYLSLKFQCTEEEMNLAKTTGINFVAIANAGPFQETSLSTLASLRDINLSNYSNTWSKTYDTYSKDASNMDYFLMSTAYNSEGSKYGYNKISASGDKYTGTTTLQRMYSRLDLWYNKQKNAITTGEGTDQKVTELKYCIVDANGNEVKSTDKDESGNNVSKDKATVFLTNVLPVNVMQKPSYLFKMVTNGITAFDSKGLSGVLTAKNYLWGGKESPTDGPYTGSAYNDKPTNYVMEPHTLQKNAQGGGSYETWYGNTSKSNVIEAIQKDLSNNTANIDNGKFPAYYHMDRTAAGSDPDYDCNHISIISYANENTHPTDCYHSNYLTGMAFRAVYVPEKIYRGYEESTTTDADGEEVKTKSLIELDQTVEAIAGGKIFRYSPTAKDQKESESLYFSDRTVAENYANANPGDMAIITEYTATQHDGKWGFICYYNLWLRHYNDVDDAKSDPHEHLPMEYATVRNNIYRVAVSFQGPGDPTPTMREPDTMKARIFVRKWNYREEPTIIF